MSNLEVHPFENLALHVMVAFAWNVLLVSQCLLNGSYCSPEQNATQTTKDTCRMQFHTPQCGILSASPHILSAKLHPRHFKATCGRVFALATSPRNMHRVCPASTVPRRPSDGFVPRE